MDSYTPLGAFFIRILQGQDMKVLKIDKSSGCNAKADPVGKGKNPYAVNSAQACPRFCQGLGFKDKV